MSSMKVILTENIYSLGQIGDVVNVAPGYARNYLFPKALALVATGKNVKELDHRKRMLAQKREKVRRELLSVAEKLNGVELVLRRKVVEDDKLYGSVSAADIISGLEAQGFQVQRKQIVLEQPIKQLGQFKVPVRMDAEVKAEVKVTVEKEE